MDYQRNDSGVRPAAQSSKEVIDRLVGWILEREPEQILRYEIRTGCQRQLAEHLYVNLLREQPELYKAMENLCASHHSHETKGRIFIGAINNALMQIKERWEESDLPVDQSAPKFRKLVTV